MTAIPVYRDPDHPHLEYLSSCRMHIGPIDIDPADTLPFFFRYRPFNPPFREVVSSSLYLVYRHHPPCRPRYRPVYVFTSRPRPQSLDPRRLAYPLIPNIDTPDRYPVTTSSPDRSPNTALFARSSSSSITAGSFPCTIAVLLGILHTSSESSREVRYVAVESS